MDWLVIDGVRPYDGRYEFDIEGTGFTTREWGWIKRHSGYLPLTVGDGFKGADPELITVFAIIALYRAGKIQPADVAHVVDRLADAPATATVRLESDTVEEEAEAGDPTLPTSSSRNGGSSGPDSATSSESQEPTPTVSGTPALDTSESPLLWSGT